METSLAKIEGSRTETGPATITDDPLDRRDVITAFPLTESDDPSAARPLNDTLPWPVTFEKTDREKPNDPSPPDEKLDFVNAAPDVLNEQPEKHEDEIDDDPLPMQSP
jgi:hypothetical protein